MVAIIKPYREIELNNQTKFAGHVHIKKVDRNGRVTFETKFKNLLTDYFIQNGFGGVETLDGSSTQAYIKASQIAILLGTGVQTAPQPGDTALNNFLEGSYSKYNVILNPGDNSLVVLGNQPSEDYLSLVTEVTFDYAQANGALTEIGLAVASGSRNMSVSKDPTHANHRLIAKSLIKDSSGNPVVVNKTDAEQLIVSYEIRVYRPNETEATFNIASTDTTLKFLTYGRTTGLEVDLRTDTKDRGGSGGDLLAPSPSTIVEYNRKFINQLGTLFFLSLYKASCPAYGGDGEVDGYSSDYNLNLPGLQFESHVRVNPTTADRNLTGIRTTYQGFAWSEGAAEPRSVSTSETAHNRLLDLRFIDPATGYVAPFLLPANYRLDLAMTFQRGRK